MSALHPLDFVAQIWGNHPRQSREGHGVLARKKYDPNIEFDDREWHEDVIRLNWLDNGRVHVPKLPLDTCPQEGKDLYFSVNLFSKPHRQNKYALPSSWLYADLDEIDPRILDIRPTVAWRSSPGHYQALWKLEKGLRPEQFAALNKALVYYVHADLNSHALNKVLRIPGTFHAKGEPVEVLLLWYEPGVAYSASYIYNKIKRGIQEQAQPEHTEETAEQILARSERVSDETRQLLATTSLQKDPSGKFKEDRSATLWKLAKNLSLAGLTHAETVRVLEGTVWNKFKNRNEAYKALWDDVARARLTVKQYTDDWLWDVWADTGNAKRFRLDWQDRLRVDLGLTGAGTTFYEWYGTRWFKHPDQRISEYGELTARRMLDAKDQIPDTISKSEQKKRYPKTQREKFLAHAMASQADGKIAAMIRIASRHREWRVDGTDFDLDPLKFNVANGTLVIKGKVPVLRAPSRDDMLTKQANVAYDPTAACPRWERFIYEIMDGDQELIDFLQRAVGYTLTGLTREQCFFILHGGGANGKTTFLEAIKLFMGEYAGVLDSKHLTTSAMYSRTTSEIAVLDGKRLAISSEIPQDAIFYEKRLKDITGGDTIAVRPLYRDEYPLIPRFKLWLGVNHLPKIRDMSTALWRRMIVIPFSVQFPEEARDKRLNHKLESEHSGILNWAMDGLKDYLDRDSLEPPAKVTAEVTEYRESEDPLNEFILDCCEIGKGYSVLKRDLFEAYEYWAVEEGVIPRLNVAEFNKAAAQRFKEIRINGHKRAWSPVRLKNIP